MNLSEKNKKRLEDGLRPHIQHAYDRGFEIGRREERTRVAELLRFYSVKAPEESYTATFTLKQFMAVLTPTPTGKKTNGACVIGKHDQCPRTDDGYTCICPCHRSPTGEEEITS